MDSAVQATCVLLAFAVEFLLDAYLFFLQFCLGGCNPLASMTLSACIPEPVCQNALVGDSCSDRVLLAASRVLNASTAAAHFP